jgi:hypothetical protein
LPSPMTHRTRQTLHRTLAPGNFSYSSDSRINVIILDFGPQGHYDSARGG